MTLTELSYYSRRFLPLGIISFLVLLIFFYAFQLLFIYLGGQQKQTVVFDPTFGAIKRLKVETVENKPNTFVIDTIEGRPITSTQSAKIFYIPPTTTRFGYRQKVQTMAAAMGFNINNLEYAIVNEKDAQYSDVTGKALIDITNYNFSYSYNIKNNPAIFDNASLPNDEQITNQATTYLKTLGVYPEEFAQGKTNIIYLRYDLNADTITTVNDARDANMAEVDFYRPDVEGVPIVPPRYFNSQNYVTLVFRGLDFTVVKSQVKYFKKSEEVIGTYPVKTGDQAWEELKQGKGLVVSMSEPSDIVKIAKMFVAYVDLDVYQEYLQPAYVFLGDHNFVGYVPAVINSYLSE